MDDILLLVGEAAQLKIDLSDSNGREEALQAQIKRIEAAIKDEKSQRAAIETSFERVAAKLKANGLKPEQVDLLAEQQAAVIRAIGDARDTGVRQQNRRPKAERQQLEIARSQGVEAGRAARADGGLDSVDNPWAAGSPEAQEFTAGLHEGFTADDDGVVKPAAAAGKATRRKSQEQPEAAPELASPAPATVVAPVPVDDTDREIEAGLADGASAADAEAAANAQRPDEAEAGATDGSDGVVDEEDPFAPATDSEIDAWFNQGLADQTQTQAQIDARNAEIEASIPF